jgi:hypothetical protein
MFWALANLCFPLLSRSCFNYIASRKRSQTDIEMDDLEEINTRVKHIRMSPSEFARYSNYSKQLKAETPPIINCHPAKNFDVPVLLYHEIFGRFLSYFENDTLTDNDKVKAYDMQSVMSDFYESEAEMAEKFRIWARSFFDRDTTAYDFIDRSQIDGVWREEIHGNTILLAIFEFKRDCSQTNPYVQACAYYAKYFSELNRLSSQFLYATCCPCFLVYNIGHFFGIAGAVVGKQITITPLIQGTLLFRREKSSWLNETTRIFAALRKASLELKDYYKNAIEQYGNSGPSLIRQTSFPYINSYTIDEDRIEFCYSKRIIDSNGKLVFQVEELQTGIKRILKFVTSYGVEVHKYCCAKSIAPELISVNTVENTDYTAIIMEDLSDMQFEPLYEIWSNLDEDQKTNLSKEIWAAYFVLREGGFVHGDLRSGNIMVRADTKNGKWTVKFIDFDWAGNAGEVKYPFSLNTDLPWHPDIKPCVNILPEHDKDTLEKSLLDMF